MIFLFPFLFSCTSATESNSTQENTIVSTTKSTNKNTNSQGQSIKKTMQYQNNQGSGGALQDPSGFPAFHDWPAPKGPKITDIGVFSKPMQLTKKPEGGYRPQIAIGKDDTMHTVFYIRKTDGDVIHHRSSTDGIDWKIAEPLGHRKERNWGPDIVVREDGSVVVVYDHALEDFSSVGYITTYENGIW